MNSKYPGVDADFVEKELLNAYGAHADAIFRHCLYRVFNKEMAEDFTQEIFLRYFEHLSKGNTVQHVKSFLYKTANNLIIDYVRRKKESSLDEMMNRGFDPKDKSHETIVDDIDAKIVIEVLKQIDEIYRIPFLLRYSDGLMPREIAEILGETENVISVRIYRGLKKVKELLPWPRDS